MHLHKLPYQGQPKTGSFLPGAGGVRDLFELFEDPLQILGRNPNSRITHANFQPAACTFK